jgi:YjjG family noncanonical pyrimidine nucleotidase
MTKGRDDGWTQAPARGGVRYPRLLLDADGTLFDYDRAESDALRAAFGGAGYAFEEEWLERYRRINDGLWKEFELGRIDQETIKARRFALLAGEVGLELDAVAFGRQYLGHLAEGTHLMEGAEEMLRALRGRCKVVVLTNGLQEVQRPRLARSAIGSMVDGVVVSEEVGAAKPDGRIFEIALEKLGNPPKREVLMVGDSLSADVRGGNEFGVDTCWFNPGGRARGEWEPTYEIQQLGELVPIVTGLGVG